MGYFVFILVLGLIFFGFIYLGVQESEKQNAIYDSMAEQMKDNPECRKLVDALSSHVSSLIDNSDKLKELIDDERAYFVVEIWNTWVATGVSYSSKKPPESHKKEYNSKCTMMFSFGSNKPGNYIGYSKVCGIDELASSEREPLKRILKNEWAVKYPQITYLLEYYDRGSAFLVFEITSLYHRRSKKTLMS